MGEWTPAPGSRPGNFSGNEWLVAVTAREQG